MHTESSHPSLTEHSSETPPKPRRSIWATSEFPLNPGKWARTCSRVQSSPWPIMAKHIYHKQTKSCFPWSMTDTAIAGQGGLRLAPAPLFHTDLTSLQPELTPVQLLFLQQEDARAVSHLRCHPKLENAACTRLHHLPHFPTTRLLVL